MSTLESADLTVALNTAGVSPVDDAVKVCVPISGPRVTVAETRPLESDARGPLTFTEPVPLDAVKLTAAPAFGFPNTSRTSTMTGLLNGIPALPVWVSPGILTS